MFRAWHFHLAKVIADNKQIVPVFKENHAVPRLRCATRSSQKPKSIPDIVQGKLATRILSYAKKHFRGQFTHIDLRFRGALCYIDAYCDPEVRSEELPQPATPEYRELLKRHVDKVIHLCRLRYIGSPDNWGFDFFAYSSEKYEPSVFPSGLPTGAPEEAFDLAATMYL